MRLHRRKFIKLASLTTAGLALNPIVMAHSTNNELSGARMPVLFMGHGSPMNAVEDNPYTKGWYSMVQGIPTPKAVLIISAHWETSGQTKVYAGEKPKMIYDMHGFPQNLYEVNYPCDGSPALADQITKQVQFTDVAPTHDWGLDHGAWSVLVKMFPDASIPCFQMSLNTTRDLQWHYNLAKELSFLRKQGVLIVGSGNIVHNLRYMRQFYDPAPDWALEFDARVVDRIKDRNHKDLINYQNYGKAATISVNSAEHYIPMLYALALQEKDEDVTFSNHDIEDTLLGKSMRCFRFG